ncbi:hypothetical protein Hanom_Chr11g01034171 [Helianthus anomalus]
MPPFSIINFSRHIINFHMQNYITTPRPPSPCSLHFTVYFSWFKLSCFHALCLYLQLP